MTPQDEPTKRHTQRRHVVGFLLSSIVVAVIGLVTGIIIMVSGILNSFSEVSTSRIDPIATGTELGPNTEDLDLAAGQHIVSSFFDTAQQPTMDQQEQACTIRDAHGKEVPTETSVQRVSEAEPEHNANMPPETTYVVFTTFQTDQEAHAVFCQYPSILSHTTTTRWGSSAIWGTSIAVVAMVIATVLFVLGIINHNRNRKAQRTTTRRRLLGYRFDDS